MKVEEIRLHFQKMKERRIEMSLVDDAKKIISNIDNEGRVLENKVLQIKKLKTESFDSFQKIQNLTSDLKELSDRMKKTESDLGVANTVSSQYKEQADKDLSFYQKKYKEI